MDTDSGISIKIRPNLKLKILKNNFLYWCGRDAANIHSFLHINVFFIIIYQYDIIILYSFMSFNVR